MIDKFNEYFKNNFCWRGSDGALCEKLPGGKLRKIAPGDLAQGYLEAKKKFCEDPGCTYEEIIDFITKVTPDKKDVARPKKIIPGLGQVVSWINEQLQNQTCPYHMSLKGDFVTYTYDSQEISSTDKKIVSWLNQRVRDLDLKKVYTVGDISDGWAMYKDHRMAIAHINAQDKIKFDGTPFVNEFLHYIYDYLQIKEDYDIYEMMFKHWMWCLKRRIFGKPVIWHIWLNFNGAQGIGKTQMLNRMFKFIEDFIITTNLRIMNDVDREYRKFTDNYVIIFDDLNSGENSDNDVSLNDDAVDAIKQIMTQEVLSIRQFQTQDQNKVKNTFVPISTANKHLYDIIYDGDAMRRWFEFNCQREKAPASFDELNSVLEKFTDALRGIDENNDQGYWDRNSDVGKRIIEIQKHYIPTNTSTNTWIDYCNVKPDYDRQAHTTFMAPEYKQYCTYCRAVGKHSAGLQRVTMIFGRLWPKCIDEKGIAHVFIESRVDEVNGELILNDPVKFNAPIANDDSEDLIKEWSDEKEIDYTPSKKISKGLF